MENCRFLFVGLITVVTVVVGAFVFSYSSVNTGRLQVHLISNLSSQFFRQTSFSMHPELVQ